MKVCMAVFCELLEMVEMNVVHVDYAKLFASSLINNQPQPDPYLECLANFLRTEAPRVIGHFRTSLLVSSCLDILNGMILESALPIHSAQKIPGFHEWIRGWNAGGTAVGQFLIPTGDQSESHFTEYVQLLPAISDMQSYVNDILSFYKERIIRREKCYLHQVSLENQCSEMESLKELCSRTSSLYLKNCEVMGQSNSHVRQIYRDYVMGYIEWHFYDELYKLNEMGLRLFP
ncbi:hypothetical protein JDV02_008045 [Purpureocillium takamizusanense]|uniref:Trichodiene synthase n=1 Tax=Purpureocillium takamizusanense TaxID=2060973 RepID=A0A9Q8QM30_9HYPO|nr:uncharacterized protein JDV02_008045 [Purpureocillium takamizusanense]UNI22125.1 hypothetical protein JDV02_008045 [Purpureocillium takamizusanense]